MTDRTRLSSFLTRTATLRGGAAAPSAGDYARRVWSVLEAQPTWLCVLPAILLLPFLHKAFHIDDTLVLIYARAIARAPFNPFTQVFDWDAYRLPIAWFPHPLLWPFLVAFVSMLFGEREWVLHLLTCAFAVLGLHGLAILARRFAVSPFVACTLLAGSSAFLVMGSTIMPDVALMGCVLAGFARLVRGEDENSCVDRLLAGVLSGLAFLIRYTGLVSVVLLLAYPVLRRKLNSRSALPFLVGISFVIGSELLSGWLSGAPHFLRSTHTWSSPLTLDRVVTFGFALVIQLGGQLPQLGIVIGAIALRGARGVWTALSALAIALVLAAAQPGRQWWLAALLFAWPALTIIGQALILLVDGARMWLEEELDELWEIRLLCIFWLLITTFATIRYVHVAAKYALLPLPSAILLTLDAFRELAGRRAMVARWWLTGSVVASLLVGSLVALGDYRWAGLYRDFFETVYREQVPATGITYFNGDWGFRYYGEREGFVRYRGQALTSEDRLLLTTAIARSWLGPITANEIIAQYTLGYRGPFAILDKERGAGFYSNGWGLYPYVPAGEVTDTVSVLRVPTIPNAARAH